jgi:hypothetical protein
MNIDQLLATIFNQGLTGVMLILVGWIAWKKDLRIRELNDEKDKRVRELSNEKDQIIRELNKEKLDLAERVFGIADKLTELFNHQRGK